MSANSITSSDSSVEEASHARYFEKKAQKGVKCLPCFTHISTGACIYGDHCRFIHDKNLFCESLPNTTLEQRNNVDHKIRDDPIYWPPSFYPNVIDEYTLDNKIVFHDDLRYKAIYTMWGYFVGVVSAGNRIAQWSNEAENPLTRRQRLPVFAALADGAAVDEKTVKAQFSYANVTKAKHPRENISRFHSMPTKHQTSFYKQRLMIPNPTSLDIASHTVARVSA